MEHKTTFTTLIHQDENGNKTLSIIKEAIDKLSPKPILTKKKLTTGKIQIDIKFESSDLHKKFSDEIVKNHINFKFE